MEGGALAEHHQLGGPAAEPDRERVVQVILPVHVPLDQRQLLGHAERLARGQDRHLGHRVGVLGQRRRVTLGDDDGVVLVRENVEKAVRTAVETLPEREREVVKLRFGLDGDPDPHSLEEIGRKLGLTRERVRQIETQALKRLAERREVAALVARRTMQTLWDVMDHYNKGGVPNAFLDGGIQRGRAGAGRNARTIC